MTWYSSNTIEVGRASASGVLLYPAESTLLDGIFGSQSGGTIGHWITSTEPTLKGAMLYKNVDLEKKMNKKISQSSTCPVNPAARSFKDQCDSLSLNIGESTTLYTTKGCPPGQQVPIAN